MAYPHARSSGSSVILLLALAMAAAIATWWLLEQLLRVLGWLLVGACRLSAALVCRLRTPREREHIIIRRRLGFEACVRDATPVLPRCYTAETRLMRLASRAERAHQRQVDQLRRQGWSDADIAVLLESADEAL